MWWWWWCSVAQSCLTLCNPIDCSILDCRPSPDPRPSPGACSNSYAFSRWCHPTILSSVVPFSSCLQSFPASGSFPVRQLLYQVAKELELQLQHQSFQWIFRGGLICIIWFLWPIGIPPCVTYCTWGSPGQRPPQVGFRIEVSGKGHCIWRLPDQSLVVDLPLKALHPSESQLCMSMVKTNMMPVKALVCKVTDAPW